MIKVEHNSDFERTKPHISPLQASFVVSNMRNCDKRGRVIRVMNSHGIDCTISSICASSKLLNHVCIGNANHFEKSNLHGQSLWQTTFTFSPCAYCTVVILSMRSWTEFPRKSHIDLVKHTSWQSIKGCCFRNAICPKLMKPILKLCSDNGLDNKVTGQ